MLAADIEVLLMQYLIKKNIVDLIKKNYISYYLFQRFCCYEYVSANTKINPHSFLMFNFVLYQK